MNELNHTCIICGKKYHACNSCDHTALNSWRSFFDTNEHYKIYCIINDYCRKVISKEQAKKLLAKCDLNNFENWVPEVVNTIKEIKKDKFANSKNKKIENNNENIVKPNE